MTTTTEAELNFAKFLAKWSAEYPVSLPAGPLLSLAEECGVRLAGRTTRAKQISLGAKLSQHVGAVIEFEGVRLTIRRAHFTYGRQYYAVENFH